MTTPSDIEIVPIQEISGLDDLTSTGYVIRAGKEIGRLISSYDPDAPTWDSAVTYIAQRREAGGWRLVIETHRQEEAVQALVHAALGTRTPCTFGINSGDACGKPAYAQTLFGQYLCDEHYGWRHRLIAELEAGVTTETLLDTPLSGRRTVNVQRGDDPFGFYDVLSDDRIYVCPPNFFAASEAEAIRKLAAVAAALKEATNGQ